MEQTERISRPSKVFIPALDIFGLAGPDAFKQMEASQPSQHNLVVFPIQFAEGLAEGQSGTRNFYSSAAEDTLEYVRNLQLSKYSHEQVKRCLNNCEKNTEGVAIFRAAEGLDIAFLDHKAFKDKGEFSMESLEHRVTELFLNSSEPRPAILSTRNIDHIAYDARGLRVQAPKFLSVDPNELVGRGVIEGNPELYLQLDKRRRLSIEWAHALLKEEFVHNQIVKFVTPQGARYARVTGKLRWNNTCTRIVEVTNRELALLPEEVYSPRRAIHMGGYGLDTILGISPKDTEQYLALEYGALNPEISLLFLTGGSGTGKTVLAYASAVAQILLYDQDVRVRMGLSGEKKQTHFNEIIVIKPTDILGGKKRDPGILPGGLLEKLSNHLQSYADAHDLTLLGRYFPFEEMFLDPRGETSLGPKRSDIIKESKIASIARLKTNKPAIQLTSLAYIRGRSFSNALVILDEAQNATPYEVKTLLERMGLGCKCIILGDPYQVDNPDCSRNINGLTHTLAHFFPEPYCWAINLQTNYRHQMAKRAQEMTVYGRS